MTSILLSSNPGEAGIIIIFVAALAINIFLIVKFLDLAKDVKNILFVLQGISRDSKTTATAMNNPPAELQTTTWSIEELNKRIVGAWSCAGNIVYYINADGTYEKKKYKMSSDNDMIKKVTGYSIGNNRVKIYEERNVIEVVKGSWNIENTIISFSNEDSQDENEIKKNTFEIVDFGLTTMKFVNSLTHSEIRLTRI